MFGHLQVYSYYSLQKSTITISELITKAQQLHIDALALTDINVMYGAMEFTHACKKAGIKPIYGLEITTSHKGSDFPITCLAKNDKGYECLMKLSSIVCTSASPIIEIEKLSLYKDDLYFILSGSHHPCYSYFCQDMDHQAGLFLDDLKDLLGSSFYIGVSNLNISLMNLIYEKITSLAKIKDIKVIWVNAVAYLEQRQARSLAYLEASKQQKEYHAPLTNQAYLKSEEEISKLYSSEILKNTQQLVLDCNATIAMGQFLLPKFPLPDGKRSDLYLKALCLKGLEKRFNGRVIPKTYYERLSHELEIIIQMHFEDYFLIVWDYVKFAKSQGIFVGCGRGSAAGSLVSYVLGITNIDPLKYGLIFERFLNPDRVSMPDIDVDFEDARRKEVVDYIIEKYGRDHVCQIVTFNSYGPRVAIKDIGKVEGIPNMTLDLLAKKVPTGQNTKQSCYQMYQNSHDFQSSVNKDERLKRIIQPVFDIEKLYKTTGIHPAGIVLSGKKISDVIPIIKDSAGTVLSQYEKDYIEEVGLLKMDVLALKNLSILHSIMDGIEEKIDINQIPLDDKKTYDMIGHGDTFGIFQLEKSGIVSLLRQLGVTRFEDIVAAIALYRPGPMENIPVYLRRKKGEEAVTYLDDSLKDILEETYGIMIYQEQIMQVAVRLAGFTLAKADTLRKSISKKGDALMQSLKAEFIDGVQANGYPRSLGDKAFSDIEKFAGYGFNKSHSVAYGMLAYQLAYLKAHYPLQFFAALLSNSQSSEDSILKCLQETKKYGVQILPPSVNHSTSKFIVDGNNIRYALTAIKEVGQACYQLIEANRNEFGPFESYEDFVSRMFKAKMSMRSMEYLIDAGALDEFNLTRRTMKENLGKFKENAELSIPLPIDIFDIDTYREDDVMIVLDNEKKALGVYLSMHPVVYFKNRCSYELTGVGYLLDHVGSRIYGIFQITRVKIIRDKKGQNMCFLNLLDETGNCDGVCFSDLYEANKDSLKKGNIILVDGKVTFKNDISLTINKLKLLKDIKEDK